MARVAAICVWVVALYGVIQVLRGIGSLGMNLGGEGVLTVAVGIAGTLAMGCGAHALMGAVIAWLEPSQPRS